MGGLPGLAAWVARRRGAARLGLGLLAGGAMTLGQPPFSLPLLWLIAVPVLVWLLEGTQTRAGAAMLGWAAGFGYFLSGLFWIGHAFLIDAEEFAWALPFAITLLPAVLAVYWALAFAIARAGRPRVLMLAAALTLAEYARGHLFTGFPWGLPGYIWVETPLMQSVAVLGPFGLTLVTLVLSGAPLAALAARRRAAAGLAVAGLGALWVHGTLVLARPDPPPGPVIRIVQPNAELTLKRDPVARALFQRRLLEGSAAAPDPAYGPPAAVVWPESAVDFLPAYEPERRAEIAAAAGVPVILGALHAERTETGDRWSNDLMVIGADGEIAARYAKHHLVPFGEYMPMAPLFGLIGVRQLADRGGFTPGPGPQTITVPGLPPFAALICYEGIFPHQIVAPGPRPDWIVVVTNDGWFGRFNGPQQHLAQARIRAIEQGLPVVRAAATGISAIIDSRGRITGRIELGTFGPLDRPLPGPGQPTVYAASGDLPAILGAIFLGFVCFFRPASRKPIESVTNVTIVVPLARNLAYLGLHEAG